MSDFEICRYQKPPRLSISIKLRREYAAALDALCKEKRVGRATVIESMINHFIKVEAEDAA